MRLTKWPARIGVIGLMMSLAILPVALVPVGCTTSQQTLTYKTLYTLETSTTAAYDSYLALVVNGTLATNAVPAVSAKFNLFQASFLVALSAAQYNTNALAPASLAQESADVINLINVIKTKP
jgi:hypothetical protein